jgi:hypothetical protein
VKLQEVWYINVYAPSGAEKRENFFNSDLNLLLRAPPAELLLVSDFNRILNTNDSTENAPRTKCLERIVKGLEQHVWDASKARHGFTRCAPLSTTGLHRMSLETHIHANEGWKRWRRPFAVGIRLATEATILERERRDWKMNISRLNDKDFCEVLRQRWNKWQTHKHYYTNDVMWTRCVKAE